MSELPHPASPFAAHHPAAVIDTKCWFCVPLYPCWCFGPTPSSTATTTSTLTLATSALRRYNSHELLGDFYCSCYDYGGISPFDSFPFWLFTMLQLTGGASWRPIWAPAPLPPKKIMRLWFTLLVRLLQATHVSKFIHGSCRTIQRGPRAIMSIAFLAFCIVWLWLLDNASRRSLFIVFASCCYLTGCGACWALSPGHRKKSTWLLRGYN